MNRQDYIKTIQDFYKRGVEVVDKKSADYAGDDDPFKNFRLGADLGLVTVEQNIFLRLCDKIGRIANLLGGKEAKVSEESIEDNLLDAANYLGIIYAYRKTSRPARPIGEVIAPTQQPAPQVYAASPYVKLPAYDGVQS